MCLVPKSASGCGSWFLTRHPDTCAFVIMTNLTFYDHRHYSFVFIVNRTPVVLAALQGLLQHWALCRSLTMCPIRFFCVYLQHHKRETGFQRNTCIQAVLGIK